MLVLCPRQAASELPFDYSLKTAARITSTLAPFDWMSSLECVESCCGAHATACAHVCWLQHAAGMSQRLSLFVWKRAALGTPGTCDVTTTSALRCGVVCWLWAVTPRCVVGHQMKAAVRQSFMSWVHPAEPLPSVVIDSMRRSSASKTRKRPRSSSMLSSTMVALCGPSVAASCMCFGGGGLSS